ncbi:hypothetical protein F2Q68_00029863 [Brassica cretica]|uniref:Uncharacterized protein n=1 Tax=Brassica cretica TaxID=69181 RepID=A0A8S9G437_BRACR|nr:hypothetical protein F2Q68_00029863 [Brassica cretica]
MVNLLVSFWFVLINSVYANTCFNRSGFFAPNGTYDVNRRVMLSSLPSNVTANDGLYTTSATGQDPNRVYGLGMCVPGTEERSCFDCIMAASNGLVQNCTTQIEAIDWRIYRTALCLVRYSNRSFYGSLDLEIIRDGYNTRDFQPNATDFDTTLEALMIGLIDDVPSLYYAAGTQTLESSNTNIYGFVQCSRDLSIENCTKCLEENVIEYRSCCSGRQGGIISRPSCFVRWEIFPFLELFDNSPRREKDGKGVSTGTIVAIVIVPILLLSLGFGIWRRRKSYKAFTTENGYFSTAKRLNKTYNTAPPDNAGDDITTSGSLQFDYEAIEAATSNFHNTNKLGHGGFGEVYKGTFPNGTEIAVKRLSKTSGQGEREFKNEVLLVAKLQHRNLVRLLGFCVQGDEKILVYEFLPNKSLNYFLFGDSTKRSQLDWTRRYKIIGGITRGILYLHQDSRLTIIHRDLKASNILLDADMNPKIADFGMARNFKMDQTEDNTRRVVGTFGYMPPEYVANGQFSTKSDVYSFGVLILEIIGGKKNSSFHEIDGSTGNLVTYVWRLWNNDSLMELVDPVIGVNYDKYEVIRCVHIGLLCVQEKPTDRPSMFTIFQMLTNTSITLPVPQPPEFFFRVRSENIPLAESFQPAILVIPESATFRFISASGKMLPALKSWMIPLHRNLYSTMKCTLQESGFFAPDGTYDLNRRVMLSSLASNVTANDGFYTTSATGQDPNRVYGLGMCVPGTEERSCSDCIMAASNGLVQNCTTQTEAIDWRMHSNTLCLEALMIGLIEDVHVLYYAAGTQTVESTNTNLYGFVQCSRDLSRTNCTRCLQQNVIDYRSCCSGSQGGIVSRPSCFVRWEIDTFLGLFDNSPPREKDKKIVSTRTIVAIVIVPIILLALAFARRRRKSYKAFSTENGYLSAAKRLKKNYDTAPPDNAVGDDISASGSLQFDFKCIEAATSNFHNTNKIGHGGFGEVYKGTFPNGTEIAVKRLSKTSGQGEREFKNEVLLVAKLQHRNLVRLLGFCVQGEEKILVYEFLPNKSLNYFLFGGMELWNNDSLLELVDPVIGDNYDKYEVIRCVHIGLLCVQENPTDRPTMLTIFQMLTNTSVTLPVPEPPGFFFRVRSEKIPLAESLQPVTNRSVSLGGSISLSTAELDQRQDGSDEEDINGHNGSRYIKVGVRWFGSRWFGSRDIKATIRPPGVKASKGFGKKTMAEGKRLTEFQSLWSIRKEDIAAKERLTKMKLLESLVRKEELAEYEEALKKKLIDELLSN